MGRLQGKKVVLGVSGGIAAYKALFLVRELRRHGAEVHVIMTEHATKLVTPLSFRELSGQPVTTTMWGEITHWNVEHIALANLADVFVLAPATANLIGKVANGIADDMLTTTVMATPAPVVVVPAMNTRMYENPFTQSNLQKLASAGYTVPPLKEWHRKVCYEVKKWLSAPVGHARLLTRYDISPTAPVAKWGMR